MSLDEITSIDIEPFQVNVFNMIRRLKEEGFKLALDTYWADTQILQICREHLKKNRQNIGYTRGCVPFRKGFFNILVSVDEPKYVIKNNLLISSQSSDENINYQAANERVQICKTLVDLHILKLRNIFLPRDYYVGQIVNCGQRIDEGGIEINIKINKGREYEAEQFRRIAIPYIDKILRGA